MGHPVYVANRCLEGATFLSVAVQFARTISREKRILDGGSAPETAVLAARVR